MPIPALPSPSLPLHQGQHHAPGRRPILLTEIEVVPACLPQNMTRQSVSRRLERPRSDTPVAALGGVAMTALEALLARLEGEIIIGTLLRATRPHRPASGLLISKAGTPRRRNDKHGQSCG